LSTVVVVVGATVVVVVVMANTEPGNTVITIQILGVH